MERFRLAALAEISVREPNNRLRSLLTRDYELYTGPRLSRQSSKSHPASL